MTGAHSDLGFLHDEELLLKARIGPSAAYEIREILKFAAGCGWLEILGDKRKLSDEDRRLIDECVSRRLGGEPLAYITGEAEFMELKLHVNPHVLIPRPETEILVEEAASYCLTRGGRKLNGLDLGVGSGNITLSLLERVSSLSMDAVDKSPEALKVFERNLIRHGHADRVRVFEFDYLNSDLSKLRTDYDLVVANAPYVGSHEMAALSPEVRREPTEALEGGPEGWETIAAIMALAPRILTEDGRLILEIGFGQKDALLKAAGVIKGLKFEKSVSDDRGIDRILILRKAI